MSLSHTKQQGFAVVELVLILIVIGIVGATGWYVLSARKSTENSLTAAQKSAASTTKQTGISFEACSKQSGSKVMETSPETCVTKDGKTVTNTATAQSQDKAKSAASVSIISTTYSELPQDFKTVYVQHVKAGSTQCVNESGLPIDDAGKVTDPAAKLIPNSFVLVGECNAQAIYAYQHNTWRFVDKTVTEHSCSQLTSAQVPSSLLQSANSKSECIDDNNNVIAYTQN